MSEGWKHFAEGSAINSSEAVSIEKELIEFPNKEEQRLKLIAYYHESGELIKLFDHLCWMIEHRPESDVWLEPHMHLNENALSDLHKQKLIFLWEQKCRDEPSNISIISNASFFLRQVDPELGEKILREALQLEPDDFNLISDMVLVLYGLVAARRDNKNYAHECFSLALKALTLYNSRAEYSRICPKDLLIEPATECALLLEKLNESKELAKEYDDQHAAFEFLGRVAIIEHDVNLAAKCLQESSTYVKGKVPRLKLASELLEKGERDSVVDYLFSCSQLSFSDPFIQEQLKKWLEEIKSGTLPTLSW